MDGLGNLLPFVFATEDKEVQIVAAEDIRAVFVLHQTVVGRVHGHRLRSAGDRGETEVLDVDRWVVHGDVGGVLGP
jgi:hypothetical protein